jgi:hypothetical protein
MSIPVADDFLLAEIDTLASTVMLKLRIMRYRGRGKDAARDLERSRKELRDTLVVLAEQAMGLPTNAYRRSWQASCRKANPL